MFWTNDIDDQGINNYIYAASPGDSSGDEIGQLVHDESEEFDVEWNVYNKVTRVVWTGASPDIEELRFTYDAMQRRVGKEIDRPGTANDEAWRYVVDATGNTMAVYHEEMSGSDRVWELEEMPIYGSSRVGMRTEEVEVLRQFPGGTYSFPSLPASQKVFYRVLDEKVYELTDHLGNVRVVVTDQKQSDVFFGAPLDFTAEVVRMEGYYAFGSGMVGMSVTSEGYRYGFNTQEKVDEIYGEGNSYAAEFWQYDGRLGRRWNLDPVVKHQTGRYVSLSNSPIIMADPSGDDWIYYEKAGKELNRTKSKWTSMHWLTGDRKYTLSEDQLSKGGFFEYAFNDNPHAALIDLKTNDIYEVNHPTVDGKVTDGANNWLNGGDKSNSYIFKGKGLQIEKNDEYWGFEIDGKNARDDLNLIYLWVDDRTAVLDFLNKEHEKYNAETGDKSYPYSLVLNNCKHRTISALCSGMYDGEVKSMLMDEKRNVGPLEMAISPAKYVEQYQGANPKHMPFEVNEQVEKPILPTK